MPNETKFTATTGNAEVSGTLRDKSIVFPTVPPVGITSVGPRVTFNFITEEWSNANEYQYYDVVNISGASYVARQNVPTGIDISNEDYWFRWNDPNAEFQELENIVHTYDSRITGNTEAVAAEKTRAQAAESANTQAIEAEKTRAQAAENANTQAIETEKTRATGAETNLEETKAAKNHASADTTYGAATDTLYGHVKLYNTINDKVDGALTPNALHGYINSLKNPYNAKAHLFGDSNGTATHLSGIGIPYYMKQIFNMDVENHAVNGAVFQPDVSGYTNRIVDQIEKATSDDSQYVFIIGGINDFHYGWSTISPYANAVIETVNAAIEKFSNAEIVLMMDMGHQYPNYTLLSMCKAMAISWYNKPIHFISLCDMCVDDANWYNQNHYSSSAYVTIAKRIANSLLGIQNYGADATAVRSQGFDGSIIRNYNSVTINPYDMVLRSDNYMSFETGFFNKNTNYTAGQVIYEFIGTLHASDFYVGIPAMRGSDNAFESQIVGVRVTNKDAFDSSASNNPVVSVAFPYNINPSQTYSTIYRAFWQFSCNLHAVYNTVPSFG